MRSRGGPPPHGSHPVALKTSDPNDITPGSQRMAFDESMRLFERAERVIPGGIYGHVSPAASLPLASPYYAKSAAGCRYTDVDNRQYIDFLCAYGPIVLGYNHPEVEEACSEQRNAGDCFNHPTERTVELAEKLCEIIDVADWAVFAKNGGDMTTWAIRVAREHTRRKLILKVSGAYHGVDPWCAQQHGGVIAEDTAQIASFQWNDPQAFAELVRRNRNKIAGVIVTPFHHPSFADCADPDPVFVSTVNDLCQKHGIVLIVDDIRAGFRLNTSGSHRIYGWQPDLICFCKAIANGYPLSATVGRQALRVAASKVFLTGSYWNGAVSIVAALKTIEILQRDRLCEHIKTMGERLRDGLLKAGSEQGIRIVASGPPAAPFFRIADDPGFKRQQLWCAAAIDGDGCVGAFFHPHHNWFLCAAHQTADIDETIAIASRAFKKLAET